MNVYITFVRLRGNIQGTFNQTNLSAELHSAIVLVLSVKHYTEETLEKVFPATVKMEVRLLGISKTIR